MLSWAIAFFVIALLAGSFGLLGIAVGAAWVAEIQRQQDHGLGAFASG